MKTLLKIILSVFFLFLSSFFWLFGGDLIAGIFFILAVWPAISATVAGTHLKLS